MVTKFYFLQIISLVLCKVMCFLHLTDGASQTMHLLPGILRSCGPFQCKFRDREESGGTRRHSSDDEARDLEWR